MYSKATSRILSMIVIAVMVLTAAFAVTLQPVHADGGMPKKIKVFYYPGSNNNYLTLMGGKLQKKKSKIYNKKVLAFKKIKYDGFSDYMIKIKKAGKSKIKIKVKNVKKPVKTTIIAYKYTNAFSTYKIGDKDYKNKFAKGHVFRAEGEAAAMKGKVDIKAASGWKINDIVYYDHATYESTSIKNGDEVDVTNGEIIVEMTHNKSKIQWTCYNIVIGS